MSRHKIRLLLPITLAFFLAGCTLPFGQKSGIQITSNPQADVSIDGKSIGKTPSVEQGLKPGIVTIRLTPLESGLEPWEGKIELKPGYMTVVDRQLGRTSDSSSGYSLMSEKLSNANSTEIAMISTPPNIPVKIDGNPSGFSSQAIQSVAPGDHTFTFELPGYSTKTVRAKLLAGSRLVITVKLAVEEVIPTPTPTPLTTPTPTVSKGGTITPLPKQSTSSASLVKPYIEILNTPTGWLKVREKPSISAAELAKVNPGDQFNYKDASVSGWFQIEYLTDEWGYISSQYAKLIK